MAKQILVVGLIFFAIVGITSAASDPAEGPTVIGDVDAIGNIGGALDAAPIGSPVPAGTFPDLSTHSPAPGPSNGATALGATAGAIAVVAIAGSFVL